MRRAVPMVLATGLLVATSIAAVPPATDSAPSAASALVRTIDARLVAGANGLVSASVGDLALDSVARDRASLTLDGLRALGIAGGSLSASSDDTTTFGSTSLPVGTPLGGAQLELLRWATLLDEQGTASATLDALSGRLDLAGLTLGAGLGGTPSGTVAGAQGATSALHLDLSGVELLLGDLVPSMDGLTLDTLLALAAQLDRQVLASLSGEAVSLLDLLDRLPDVADLTDALADVTGQIGDLVGDRSDIQQAQALVLQAAADVASATQDLQGLLADQMAADSAVTSATAAVAAAPDALAEAIEAAGIDVDTLQAALDQATTQDVAAQAALSAATTTVATATAALAAATSTQAAAQSAADAADAAAATTAATLAAAQSTATAAQQALSTAQATAASAQATVDGLAATVSSLQAQIAALHPIFDALQIAALTADLLAAQAAQGPAAAALATANAQLVTAQNNATAAASAVTSSQAAHAAASATQAAAATALSSAISQTAARTSELATAQSARTAAQAAAAATSAARDAAEAALVAAIPGLADEQVALDAARGALTLATQTADAANAAVTAATGTLALATDAMGTARAMLDDLLADALGALGAGALLGQQQTLSLDLTALLTEVAELVAGLSAITDLGSVLGDALLGLPILSLADVGVVVETSADADGATARVLCGGTIVVLGLPTTRDSCEGFAAVLDGLPGQLSGLLLALPLPSDVTAVLARAADGVAPTVAGIVPKISAFAVATEELTDATIRRARAGFTALALSIPALDLDATLQTIVGQLVSGVTTSVSGLTSITGQLDTALGNALTSLGQLGTFGDTTTGPWLTTAIDLDVLSSTLAGLTQQLDELLTSTLAALPALDLPKIGGLDLVVGALAAEAVHGSEDLLGPLTDLPSIPGSGAPGQPGTDGSTPSTPNGSTPNGSLPGSFDPAQPLPTLPATGGGAAIAVLLLLPLGLRRRT